MSEPTDEKLIARLRELLAESDLETTTEKMLRKKLEEEFGVELTDRKALIRKEVEKYLEEQQGEEDDGEEEVEEEEQKPTPKKARNQPMCCLSEELSSFLKTDRMPRTEVVKRMWDYIKANNLQDPKDKRKIIVDKELGKIFTSPLTMFSINAQLSKHVKSAGQVHGAESDNDEPEKGAKRPAESKPKAKAKPAKKAKGDDGDGEAKEKKPSNFSKPVKLSQEMADFVGKAEIGRPELTSFFWKYVKDKGLQDPSDKRYIKCDAKLKALFKEDRISGFSFMKYAAPHMLKD